MKRQSFLTVIVLALGMFLTAPGWAAEVIKIGFDIELTGDIPKVGEASKFTGEMLKEQINKQGGLKVGNKSYTLNFIYEDNEAKAESAAAAALKLITQDQVLGIIGPQASKQAIPAGEVADTNQCVLISGWSTNPKTTANRPWVFRACFLDPFQGPVLAKFATEELKAKKAAVLYDIASDYPKGLAEFFKEAFEKIHGKGSVAAFETFTTKDRDFSAQLTKIVASKADILFTPQYYDEVPLIVKQAHEMGWKKPILGSDSWDSAELMNLCGKDCLGSFFSTHYAAPGAKGPTKQFIDQYKAKYGYEPDAVAALTWDAARLLLQAIQNTKGLTGDVKKDRQAIRDQLAKLKEFEGITGKMSFDGKTGDPVKCAIIVKISPEGKFEFHKMVCP
ncbi:MAG TPA: ABC transporter substrate-binding protein [Thermodesulfobacteriota bacterium]|nr:ABC transporter substrate-binding protein [Thermodesulfobacteriota bacterium]